MQKNMYCSLHSSLGNIVLYLFLIMDVHLKDWMIFCFMDYKTYFTYLKPSDLVISYRPEKGNTY